MRPLVQKLTEKVLREGLPTYTCLNVNVPKQWNGETRYCRMVHGHWRSEVEERWHPKGKPYYWMAGYYQNDEPESTDTDAWAIRNGYAAITPLTADQTDYEFLNSQKDVL